MHEKNLTFAEKRKKLAEAKKNKKNTNQLHADIANPDIELNSLFLLYQKKQYDDAENLAISLADKFPKHPLPWKVLGAVFKQTGRTLEALTYIRNAVQLAPKDSEAHLNLGNTLKELGKLEEAVTSYTQATLLEPNFVPAHFNLGNTLKQIGRLEEAKAHYAKAISLKPNHAEAHNNLGTIHTELGNYEEAKRSYTESLRFKPNNAQIHFNLGDLYRELGSIEKAESSYKQAVLLNPNFIEAHNKILNCFYMLDKKSLFSKQLDYLINIEKANAVIGSLTSRSEFRYGLKKENIFCEDPFQFVSHINLTNVCDFKAVFIDAANRILAEKRVANKQQSLLINGYQTSGNLFEIKSEVTNVIEKTIRSEIGKFRATFKDSEEGLIAKWPSEYILNGWLISLKSGGELRPHIHDQGWLSGSIYINVPPKSQAESGNLVVSQGQEKDATDGRVNVKKTIDVVTGSLVLFPASLTHYTVPFDAEEDRIVLAFDVIAK